MNFGYTVAVYFHCFPIAVAAADTVEVVYFHGFPIVAAAFDRDYMAAEADSVYDCRLETY